MFTLIVAKVRPFSYTWVYLRSITRKICELHLHPHPPPHPTPQHINVIYLYWDHENKISCEFISKNNLISRINQSKHPRTKIAESLIVQIPRNFFIGDPWSPWINDSIAQRCSPCFGPSVRHTHIMVTAKTNGIKYIIIISASSKGWFNVARA